MWHLHEGSYVNGSHPYGRGVYVGFAESIQSKVDVGKVCYCYNDDWNAETHQHDSLWVIVDKDTPHLEIGYAEFSLNNEKFYFDCGPDRFHRGDKGNYLFKTKLVSADTAIDTYFIFNDKPGTVHVIVQEDGSMIGPGGWMIDDISAMPDFPNNFRLSSSNYQDQIVSCHAEGSYASDPTLSGLHPTLKFHYDFKYKIPGTSYNDVFPSDYGKYGTGRYAECFTDNATDQIGDMILSGVVTRGEPLSSNFFMWRSALKDEYGKFQLHIGKYLFPEFNPNRQPYTTYALIYYPENDYWAYKTSDNGTYIAYKNTKVEEFLNGRFIREITVSNMNVVGSPTSYRDFDYLYNHLDDDKKIFLAGDQLVMNR